MAEHQKYKITERIDAGGMAEVFRGVAESLQGFKKNVAIKRILPHLTKNKKFISMFLDEARLSLHLQHANIVGVFDIGVSPAGPEAGGGAYFIVMEFVDGTHLKGMIESLRRQGKQLSVAQSMYMMMQVCNGLAYAHDFVDPESGNVLGIVHRDISPPNILLSKNGEVKLVDFGLAKATSQLESTDPGVVKGKFSYLSPEAANGKEVDRRADVFAVGILMYELLTGKRLFYGENDYQTVELVRQARVPSIRQQNPDVDSDLEAVVRKALARDVNARFQTAGELQDAIAQHLFSRGLKVTSRDIAELVKGCVAERAQAQAGPAPQKSLIDTLILEELNRMSSIEGEGEAATENSGARPLSPEQMSGAKALPATSPRDLIDTSSWTEELTGEQAGFKGGARAKSAASDARTDEKTASPVPVASSSAKAPPAHVRRPTPPVVPAVARRQREATPIAVGAVANAVSNPPGPAASPIVAQAVPVAAAAVVNTVVNTATATASPRPASSKSIAAILVALVALLLASGGLLLLLAKSRGH